MTTPTTTSTRFISKISNEDNGEGACWNWTACTNKLGYGKFKPAGRGTLLAHRFSYEHFVAPIPDGMLVCHRCDNPGCVNPGHLFLGTNADNLADMAKKGRSTRGERSFTAKFTEGDVVKIRKAYAAGEPQKSIALRYCTSQPTISKITRRVTWAHVL